MRSGTNPECDMRVLWGAPVIRERRFGSEAMATRVDLGAGWGWLLASGLVSVAIGLMAVIWPFSATLAATLVVGWFFLIAGAFALVGGFAGRGHRRRNYLILYGVLSVIAGLLLVFHPFSGALSLTLLVAVWLAVRGVMEIVHGIGDARGRVAEIVLGVVNLLFAAWIPTTRGGPASPRPAYFPAFASLFGGGPEIAAALHHRRGAPAFAR